MAMEAVPAGGVRDDVNGRLGASRASGRTPARHNPKMGYRDVWWCYGRSGGFEVWRDVFAFNTREPVIIPLIAEICSPTFSLRSGLRTRSSSRWMRRRCRSAGRCMRSWSGATPTASPSQLRNRTSCRECINKADTRTQARPRTTGTEPRTGDARAAIYVRDAADSIPRSAGPWVAGSVQGPVGRGRPPSRPGLRLSPSPSRSRRSYPRRPRGRIAEQPRLALPASVTA